jgi:hypothetical protein
MKRCVNIFGGIGTKKHHYKHAIEVYNANGYNINFYENKMQDILLPKRYIQTANQALKIDTLGTIIHGNSGGIWVGLDYLRKTTDNKMFICEAGPLQCDTRTLIATIEQSWHVKFPTLIYENRNAICDIIGIPHQNNKEWYDGYTSSLESITNLVCITSMNDNIIDPTFIDNLIGTVTKRGNNAIHYKFETGTHWNLSKNETQKYQDILQKHLDKI